MSAHDTLKEKIEFWELICKKYPSSVEYKNNLFKAQQELADYVNKIGRKTL